MELLPIPISGQPMSFDLGDFNSCDIQFLWLNRYVPKDINSYTHPLNHNQVNELRGILEQENYEFKSRDYAVFSAKKDKLNVTRK